MWRKTPADAPRRSTVARRGTQVRPSVSASVRRSRRASAGSRPSAGRRRRGSEVENGSAGPSPSQPPPTIWCGCQNCWRKPHERAHGLQARRPLADRQADIWDRAYLDLDGPARIVIGADGRGEIAFGAMQATLDVEYGPTSIAFTWIGSDEMDEVSGEGTPNCSTTAPSRSNSNTTVATRLSSKRSGTVFQQPASVGGSCSDPRGAVAKGGADGGAAADEGR